LPSRAVAQLPDRRARRLCYRAWLAYDQTETQVAKTEGKRKRKKQRLKLAYDQTETQVAKTEGKRKRKKQRLKLEKKTQTERIKITTDSNFHLLSFTIQCYI
jgi:hypothetical protein